MRKVVVFSIVIVLLSVLTVAGVNLTASFSQWIQPLLIATIALTVFAPISRAVIGAFIMGIISDLANPAPLGTMTLALVVSGIILPLLFSFVIRKGQLRFFLVSFISPIIFFLSLWIFDQMYHWFNILTYSDFTSLIPSVLRYMVGNAIIALFGLILVRLAHQFLHGAFIVKRRIS
ncbi:MAG: hypothetical protein WC289_03605 [Patescibacteria group bacterium]|jgi:hypothetical protein